MRNRIIAAIAAVGMISSPVLAQEAMADRASAPVEQAEGFEGTSGGALFLLAAAALIAGIVLVVDDDDPDFDEEPVSP